MISNMQVPGLEPIISRKAVPETNEHATISNEAVIGQNYNQCVCPSGLISSNELSKYRDFRCVLKVYFIY